jgi:uncharacterized membrane protein HdeD (DUF308 family)
MQFMRKRLSEWQRWWKKEMLIALSVFTLLVGMLAAVKLTLNEAPFLPLVLIFFLAFGLLFSISIWMGRKTHRDKL